VKIRLSLSSKTTAENLQLRCDVLTCEQQRLLAQLKEFDARVSDDRQQIKNIEMEQVKVQQRIDKLTDT